MFEMREACRFPSIGYVCRTFFGFALQLPQRSIFELIWILSGAKHSLLAPPDR